MIVTVAIVNMMQATIDQVVNVITVGNGLMATTWSMHMAAAGIDRRALLGIGGCDLDDVLIVVIAVRMVQVTIMQVINMAVMPNGDVATPRPMLVIRVRMGVLTFHSPPPVE